ncbi:SCO2524 family protein [Cryptosporangium sp. NPDC048952]|uniref:SCO2524 family protein n=1 Tax=Cryptosporangium sp. NPDC048952 TaxID=3363961 RepID=UPI00371B7A70
MQPRQQMLDIWRAVARLGDDWEWGGRDGRNSVSDAEQLLCLMYPASLVDGFQLDRPDDTHPDVLAALRTMGDSIEIPRKLIRVLIQYMRTYTDEEGAPDFSGGSYFRAEDPDEKVTDEQGKLHVVDSYSMSVTLTLATLGFLRVFRTRVTRADLRSQVDELEKLASIRLSAAMIGLLRSFTVNAFGQGTPPWRTLVTTVRRRGQSDDRVVSELQERLQEVRAGLRDLSIGSGLIELDNPNLLFECGWTWGTVLDAPTIDTTEPVGAQGSGLAERRPLLYFTTIALAGIVDLTSERTRVLRILNEEQQRLAAALQLRYDLTRSYWATVASSEASSDGGPLGDRWPLEELPWRTSDGEESDYFSLLVTSLVTHDLSKRNAPDSDLRRVLSVLEELSSRGRVTRRALANDAALQLHTPGVPLLLGGSEGETNPRLTWVVSDFSVMLLKRVVTLALQARSPELRSQLTNLADQVWDHLNSRRLDDGGAGALWDQPAASFGTGAEFTSPSWYHTERVMECLVLLADLVLAPPTRSQRLFETARDKIAEAEQLFDREIFAGSLDAGPSMRGSMQELRARLRRAQRVLTEKPGTADALASEVLRRLDELAAAQQSAME